MRRNQIRHIPLGVLVGSVFFMSLLSFVIVRPAAADFGDCANVNLRKFSLICYASPTQWQGIYAIWPSVPLNVDPGAAANGEYIAEALWLYENDGGSPETYLEVGDTAGGAKIGGHVNEWARMYYWVDGSTGLNIQNFIDYSPADSQPRSYELAWNGGTDWLVCAGGTCPIVAHWKNPVNFRPNTFLTVGLEINNSQRPLDSSKNSGDFLDQSVLVKYPTGLWQGWPSALSQVDSPCGSPPTCLIGSWNQPTPPYDNWLNGKPGQ